MASLPNRQQKQTVGKLRSPETSPKVAESDGEKVMLGEPIPNILVVDDDQMICQQLERLYTNSGYTVVVTNSAEEGLERLKKEDIDLVVTDNRLPGLSGVDLTKKVQELYPDVPLILITGFGDIETAVEVLKMGASDYILKPFSAAAIQESTGVVLKKAQVFTEIRHLRSTIKDQCKFGGMLSKSPEMHRVFEIIRAVSSTDVTVLVEGETGTGKELVANAIHHQSPRREGPFVTINCAGIPESLLESELFGYERGAFTGADQARGGKIEQAQGGTLFLDEIESISPAMQAKLLRVLEVKKVQRLGGNRTAHIDMRVIAATNVPLEDLVIQEKMRSDFYHRISVIVVKLNPLCQRREDIPLLIHDFLHYHPVATRKRISGISKAVIKRLMEYHWPGNIRQLQNVLERAIVLTKGRVIEEIDLPNGQADGKGDGKGSSRTLPLRQWMNEQEKLYLLRQLEATGGRIGLTAKNCGMDVKTLYRKMRLHSLDKKPFQGIPSEDISPSNKNYPHPKISPSTEPTDS